MCIIISHHTSRLTFLSLIQCNFFLFIAALIKTFTNVFLVNLASQPETSTLFKCGGARSSLKFAHVKNCENKFERKIIHQAKKKKLFIPYRCHNISVANKLLNGKATSYAAHSIKPRKKKI